MRYYASVHFDLTDAPRINGFNPARGWWETNITGLGWLDRNVVLASATGSLHVTLPADEAPDWVPRPAFGWDHSIIAIASVMRGAE